MRNCFAIFIALFLYSNGMCQNMLWTSCSVNTDIEYTMKAMNPVKKEVCVGGPSGELSYRSEPAGLFSGDGTTQIEEYNVSRGGSYLFVYDFDGRLKWNYYGYDEEERLDGICYDYRNRLVGLMLKPMNPKRVQGYYDEYEEEDDDEEEDEEEDRYCYTLCFFDGNGEIERSFCIADLLEVEITDFISHPNGGFILAGHADEGRFTKRLNLDAGKGGSDFLVCVDSTGKLVWGDALSYQKESCCTYSAEPEVAIDSKGNIIIAGAYVGGARFGGKEIRLAQIPYNAGRYYTATETYVASYSPEGKFRWVQTSGVQSGYSGLAASNGNVYVATRIYKRVGNVFGEKADTTDHQSVFVTILDENGKVKSNISTGSVGQISITTDIKGNLVVTGVIGIETGYLKPPANADKNKRRLEDVYVAFYSSNGKYLSHHLYNLLKIPSDEAPFCMAMSPTDYFLGGKLWGSLPISLHILNPAFPDKKLYGGGTFLARCGEGKGTK